MDTFTVLYVHDVHTSQEKTMGSQGLLRRYLYFLYVYVCTSQKTHLQTSMACYGDSFPALYVDMFVLHRKHLTFVYVNDIGTSQRNTPIALKKLLR
jgi:hypothetical protein